MSTNGVPILEVRNLRKYFRVSAGFVITRTVGQIRAVDGISFKLERGQTFSLVGESGCGKTTTTRAVLRVEHPTDGEVRFKGKDIYQLKDLDLAALRRSMQAVFQDPYSSLDPRMKIGRTVGEPLLIHKLAKSAPELRDRVSELLGLVGLRKEHMNLYPHEFSGGMRQRIAIARALAASPELIVLDEPVSALDVSIQAQIMNLLKELQDTYGFAYLLIAHNLATVRHLSDRVGVMYAGKLVEEGESEEVFQNPLHPYTKALIRAALPIRPNAQRAVPLHGEVPSPLNPPSGCRLHPRCSEAVAGCSTGEPALRDGGGGHSVACHNAFR